MSEELSSQSTARFVGLSSKIKKAPRIVIFLLNVFKIEIDTNLEDIYSYNNILKGKQVVVPHTTTISTELCSVQCGQRNMVDQDISCGLIKRRSSGTRGGVGQA